MNKMFEKLPDSIRIGAHDYSIVKNKADSGTWGQFDSSSLSILLSDQESPSRSKAVETVIHEIKHAIFWEHTMRVGDDEERLISNFASAWTQVLRDNPLLRKWIVKGVS